MILPVEQPSTHVRETISAPASETGGTRWEAKAREPAPMTSEEQDEAMFAALKAAAGDQPQVQVSLSILSAASGVPNGSCLTALRRLATAGRIEIIPDRPPEGGRPNPNIYRFMTLAAPAVREAEPEHSVPAETAASALADAWGAKVKPKPKPSGAVPASAPLRDRVLGVLSKSACTTSGLASMLDVKELAICQTLEAMKHEGIVQADEIPEAGRRAQLWRPAA